jgi:hypothetical protein
MKSNKDAYHITGRRLIMKSCNMKNVIRNIVLGFCASALVGCGGYNTLIKMPKVNAIPGDQYERIIKLYNPEGEPDKTLAGLVFIKKGAKVCTDYPREVNIKSLDELETLEKQAYPYFTNYVIKVGDETLGFVSIAVEYNVNLWENKKDEDCNYKVQLVSPFDREGGKDVRKSRHGEGR